LAPGVTTLFGFKGVTTLETCPKSENHAQIEFFNKNKNGINGSRNFVKWSQQISKCAVIMKSCKRWGSGNIVGIQRCARKKQVLAPEIDHEVI
jgi:hypothetical protein